MFTVVYHPLVAKDDLPAIPGNIKERLQKAIEERLMVDPISYGLPLRQSLKGYRKLRVGDYRIVYRIHDETVIVLKIGNRKDVYAGVFMRIGKG